MYELAGLVGVDPWPYTLRQLDRMARSRMQHDWIQTGSLMAMLGNIHRDPKVRRKPFTPLDFVPEWMAAEVPRHRRPPEDPQKVAILERALGAK